MRPDAVIGQQSTPPQVARHRYHPHRLLAGVLSTVRTESLLPRGMQDIERRINPPSAY